MLIEVRNNADYARLKTLEQAGADINSPEFGAGYEYGLELEKRAERLHSLSPAK